MADVILIAGCLFQPLVFPKLADLNLPTSGSLTLDKTEMDGTVARKITSDKDGNNKVEKGFVFHADTMEISITNFTLDLIGNYTLQLKNDQKTEKKILKVEPKEPRVVNKELEVKEFEEDGRRLMSCGTFDHFGDPKVEIIWKVNCRKIDVDYEYDEEKGLAIAEAELCKKGSELYFDPVDKCKFYKCGSGGALHRMNCAPGTKWDQSEQECVHLGSGEKCESEADTNKDESQTKTKRDANTNTTKDEDNKYGESTTGQFDESQTKRKIDANANANTTKDDDNKYGESTNGQFKCEKGKFYYEDPTNKCKYYQCDENGNSWIRPCAPGTKWSQAATTCIHLTEGENCTGDFEGVQVTCHVDYSSVDCPYLYRWDRTPDSCDEIEMASSGQCIAHSRELVVGFVGFFLLIKTRNPICLNTFCPPVH